MRWVKKHAAYPFWQTGFLILTGAFCGAMMMLFLQTHFSAQKIVGKENLILGLRLGFFILGATALLELRKAMHKMVGRLALTDESRGRFLQYHIFTYAIFLGYGFVLAGIKANFAFALLLLVLFFAAQAALLWAAADRLQKERWLTSLDAVPALFFLSGFAALIYQVVWQRVLFTTFGTNIESVTVIVSIFMFGLGIGALAGGQLQKYFPTRLLECFVAIEIAIGLFGIFSIPLIHTIGAIAPHDSLPALIAATYALLALPTMLMGSTLPLLVGYLQKRYATLGAVVGKLYAYNTLGSACAAFLTVMLLFTMMGQQATLIVAASCNALTAYAIWMLYKKTASYADANTPSETGIGIKNVANGFSYRKALLVSALVGYISLSLEILWFRILGFMTANMPQVFGTLLAVFLAGIAYGSLKAKRWSESGREPRDFIWRSLLWLMAVAYLSIPVAAMVSAQIGEPFGEAAGYIAIGLLAYFSGGIFPMLCQTGIHSRRGQQTGVAVSWMYFLNIVGATLGSLVTGFVLLDIFTLAQNAAIICAVIAVLLLLLLRKPFAAQLGPGAATLVLAVCLYPMLYGNAVYKLQGLPENFGTFKHISETRHGIITVMEDPEGDIIFGNGAYDGRFNIDPILNSNHITRAYMVAALHPKPKRILEIGLSSGSGARALTLYKPLQELVSIEINPGYSDIIRHYPAISPIFSHQKFKHYVDDGRRWLTNNPTERFDAIVMNTTYYWRNNATNLLSREFLELCKSHLNPGGVIYYNTTGARDIIYTAAHVFKYVTTYMNFVAASDSPFSMSYAQKKRNLLAFAGDDGRSVFGNSKSRALLEKLAREPLQDIRGSILSEKGLWLITDDNMASEYKVGHSFLPPSAEP